jgi:protein-tyrosine phosphatase
MKVYEIIPGKLYQSAKTHDLTIVERIDLVKQYNLNIVVNLWHTIDEMMIPLVEHYIFEYFPDGKGADITKMEEIADNMTMLLDSPYDGVALVHCWGGRNRSGLLNAMILMKLYGFDGNSAYEHIRTMRPNSLVNETFANWLKER